MQDPLKSSTQKKQKPIPYEPLKSQNVVRILQLIHSPRRCQDLQNFSRLFCTDLTGMGGGIDDKRGALSYHLCSTWSQPNALPQQSLDPGRTEPIPSGSFWKTEHWIYSPAFCVLPKEEPGRAGNFLPIVPYWARERYYGKGVPWIFLPELIWLILYSPGI